MAASTLLERPEPRKHHNGKLVAWDVDSCMAPRDAPKCEPEVVA